MGYAREVGAPMLFVLMTVIGNLRWQRDSEWLKRRREPSYKVSFDGTQRDEVTNAVMTKRSAIYHSHDADLDES